MKQERIEAGACDTGPNKLRHADSAVHSKNRPESPRQSRVIPPLPEPHSGVSIAQWRDGLVEAGLFSDVQVVDGDGLGPIAVLDSPRVCVGFRDDCTVVWVERAPWGWSDPYRLYLKANSSAARRYAVALAERIRDAAHAEQARRERIRDAKVRERLSFLNGGDE